MPRSASISGRDDHRTPNASDGGRWVPECFSDHVFVSDAVVGQGLAPHRVQRVVQGLGSKFIGLEDKRRAFSGIVHRASASLGSIRAHASGVRFL